MLGRLPHQGNPDRGGSGGSGRCLSLSLGDLIDVDLVLNFDECSTKGSTKGSTGMGWVGPWSL